jgi:hypothetical protein
MRVLTIGILPALCFLSAGFAQAEEIIPDTGQTTLLRGTARVSDGIRAVTGETDATGHGPITYYNVPFDEGTFSLSWKVEKEQSVAFVFDGKRNGKATHVLKVYVNGGPSKRSNENTLTLVTYDGSTRQKKKAKVVTHRHHADAGQWHEISVTFIGNQATVVVDRKIFTVTSERLRESIEKCSIGHSLETLQTKGLKIDKRT